MWCAAVKRQSQDTAASDGWRKAVGGSMLSDASARVIQEAGPVTSEWQVRGMPPSAHGPPYRNGVRVAGEWNPQWEWEWKWK